MAKKRNQKHYTIGIDLGGTKILTCLFDQNFRVVSSSKTKTDTEKGPKRLVASIIESVEQVAENAKVNLRHMTAIGIACPGVVDEDNESIVSCPNISFLKNYPIARKLKENFHARICIENDVNAGLYGEQQFGSARGYSHVAGIFPGTGIGGALILNGKLYRGAFGAAGEVGHILLDPMGPVCGCGRRGCLEAMTGRIAIASEAAALAMKQKAPNLFEMAGSDVSKIKSRVLKKAIDAGDRAIEDLIAFKARLIGIGMATIVNLLNPELIVLGGGLVEAMPNIFLRETKKSMRQHAMAPLVKHVKVVTAQLKDYSVAMGVAKMAMDLKNEQKSKKKD